VNKKIKIAFVARTIGLEYDDRIRKESLALTNQGAEVFIYVNFADNREENGLTSYGIAYKSFKLKSRDLLPSSKFLLIKSIDFYFNVRKYLSDYDVVWAHEEYTYLFPLLIEKDKCIWDLHEIPFRFEHAIMKPIFHYIESRSKKLIHANKYRIQYLKSSGVIKYPEKNVYLNNYPDDNFLLSNSIDNEYSNFMKWLGDDSKYVYLQGLTVERRYPLQTIEAIMETSNLRAIVVGEFNKDAYEILEKKYSLELNERIYFRGMVNQLDITAYIKNALFSIVLYDTKTPNNRYCEPNRLYQSILMGIPVIVGCNEPMKKLVDFNKFGISLESDGSKLEDIVNAIDNLLSNYQYYLTAVTNNTKHLVWSNNNIKETWYKILKESE